ncbi:hypothetical protein U1Q18_034407 [Sarracenia purpurea var. burkii]
MREADVDGALFNTVAVQMRLGMFDGEPSTQRYGNLGPRDVCTSTNRQLALEAARQGVVLLKNRGNSLPLSFRRHRTVAVVGPNSNATVQMIGNYAGDKCTWVDAATEVDADVERVSSCIDVGMGQGSFSGNK